MTNMLTRAVCTAWALALLFLIFPAAAEQASADAPVAEPAAVDHLGVSGPIDFAGRAYRLAWSAAPRSGYWKQEYVPDGQSADAWTQMLLVELLADGTKVADTVRAQVRMLNPRGKADRARLQAAAREQGLRDVRLLRDLKLLHNGDEVILEFVLAGQDDADAFVVEWNAYRYAPWSDGDGRTGVLLFGASERVRGAYAGAMAEALQGLGQGGVAALAAAPLPAVTPP